MTFQPLGTRLVLSLPKKIKVSEGGIELPEGTVDDDNYVTSEVLALGPLVNSKLFLKGTKVLIGSRTTPPVTIEGKKVLVMFEEDIIGIFEN